MPDFIRPREEITVDYEPGTVQDITLEDGSHVLLRKLDHEYDATDRIGALRTIHESRTAGEFVTGLLYVDTQRSRSLRKGKRYEKAARTVDGVRVAHLARGLGSLDGRLGRSAKFSESVSQAFERVYDAWIECASALADDLRERTIGGVFYAMRALRNERDVGIGDGDYPARIPGFPRH